MSRDDYDDDYDRPRRRRPRDEDEYDDIGRSSGSSSGSVTAVGVISIILGSLTLLCGLCFMFFGIFAASAVGGGPQFGQNMLPFQAAAGILIVLSLLVLVLGTLDLVGGIGVLQRRTWGRIMSLVMGGFSLVLGILFLIAAVAVLASPVPPGSKVGGFLVYLVAVAAYFTHGIMSFVVLLSGRNAREFE